MFNEHLKIYISKTESSSPSHLISHLQIPSSSPSPLPQWLPPSSAWLPSQKCTCHPRLSLLHLTYLIYHQSPPLTISPSNNISIPLLYLIWQIYKAYYFEFCIILWNFLFFLYSVLSNPSTNSANKEQVWYIFISNSSMCNFLINTCSQRNLVLLRRS